MSGLPPLKVEQTKIIASKIVWNDPLL